MLVITGWKNEEFEEEDRPLIWHLGDPVPNLSRVAKFQADGDELWMIEDAMKTASNPKPTEEIKQEVKTLSCGCEVGVCICDYEKD